MKITKIAVFCCLLLFSCGKKDSSCPEKNFSEEELIESYHKKYFPEKVPENKKFAIYLDYSGSVKTAFKDFNTQNFYQLFINSLKISEVDFYEVNNFSIDKIAGLQTSELYKKIKDASKFRGDNAPLNKAVKQIIKTNSEAVFITDGELWENGERDDPWAREEFEKWLKAGNKLEFFVTDHPDGGKLQHLFYICFVPKNSSSTVINDFKFYLNNSGAAKTMKYANFSFSSSGVVFDKKAYEVKTGGLNQNAFLDEGTYKNFENFEYIPLQTSWKDLFKYVYNAYGSNGKPLENGAPLLSKMKILFDGLEFYNVGKIVLKTYNVSADFEKFKRICEIRENTPTFLTDENGEFVLDQNREKIILCRGDFDGYDDKGELKADTVFKPQKQLPILENLFVTDFSQSGQELNIKLSPDFSGMLSRTENNLLRIDVVLKDVSVNTQNINMEKFIWQGKQVKENRSMYNSVLGALNAANPEGKTVYTFYLNTLPYKL